MANELTRLLNKIERRLGLVTINLPEQLAKDKWAEIIQEDTLPTFSRYFPNRIRILVDNTVYKDGYYFIDKDLPEGTKILGVKDIAWEAYRADNRISQTSINCANWDFIQSDYSVDDIALTQMRADFTSLFNLGIYIDFKAPNKIRLESVNGSTVNRYSAFPVDVFVEHNINLMTISPTMMETFENLAMCDVAVFLYQSLKYYDGIDTVFGNLDLKLEVLQEWANKRDDLVSKLDAEHVTTANEEQMCIMTV